MGLASGADPSAQQTPDRRLAYVDGENNDVIHIYLDAITRHHHAFENYHDSLPASLGHVAMRRPN